MWCSVQFRNRICGGSALRPKKTLLALRQGLPWKFSQIRSIIVLGFGKLGSILNGFLFPGAAGDVPNFSGAGDVSTETEVRHKRRRKHAVIARRLVPLSGQQPGPVEFGSRERSRELFEQAFDAGNAEIKRGYFRFGSSWLPHFTELF